MQRLDYIDLKYVPSGNELVCEYYLEPVEGVSFEKAVNETAGESSIETWSEIVTLKPGTARKLMPHVFYLNKKKGIAKIAYPQELFEEGNMPQILSSIAGNIFGMKVLKNLRLLDVSFPKKIVDSFKGPSFGVNGVRKVINVRGRPLTGTIVKPKLGLNEEEHAEYCYNAWTGGLDVVKDDENLSSMKFNSFEKRVRKVLELKEKAEKETGEKKLYLANVSAETTEMIKRTELVKELGGESIMVDIITVGWAGVQTLRKEANELIIHFHRAGHAMFTQNPFHGMSMLVVAKISRLIGGDNLHIGTIDLGKMKGSKKEILKIQREIQENEVMESNEENLLYQNWFGKKPVFAVASGGLQPAMIPELVKQMGDDVIMQFGGGCSGHPKGVNAGAKAIRQALEATLKGISLREYASKNEELRIALEKWGIPKH